PVAPSPPRASLLASTTLFRSPVGDYTVVYSYVGAEAEETTAVTVDAAHRTVDLGRLVLGSNAVKMEKVEVAANTSRPKSTVRCADRKSTRLNSSHTWNSYAVF